MNDTFLSIGNATVVAGRGIRGRRQIPPDRRRDTSHQTDCALTDNDRRLSSSPHHLPSMSCFFFCPFVPNEAVQVGRDCRRSTAALRPLTSHPHSRQIEPNEEKIAEMYYSLRSFLSVKTRTAGDFPLRDVPVDEGAAFCLQRQPACASASERQPLMFWTFGAAFISCATAQTSGESGRLCTGLGEAGLCWF